MRRDWGVVVEDQVTAILREPLKVSGENTTLLPVTAVVREGGERDGEKLGDERPKRGFSSRGELR